MEGQFCGPPHVAKLTSSDDVVDNQDLLARLDGILLHLEEIGAVLLLVLGGDARAGQLALLAHRGETGAETEGQAGSEEEAAGVEADNNVGNLLAKGLLDLELEDGAEGLVDGGVEEEGHDIDEVDALDGEVGEVTQGALELYLPTGEFGGGGGGGGGLSSLGILRGVGV